MPLSALLKARFGPFRHPRFRIFYSAQSLSLIGNWMQEIARSWIILSLTGKASAMGILLAAQAVPGLLFGTFGGSIADQRDVRSILIVTQVALATLAFSLGIVVSQGNVELWHLIVFAAMEGTIIAFDMPAFYKITPSLVPREDFQQALALNSVSFHLSRVLGPTIAGIVMGIWGTASVFWINAVSFLGIVLVVARMPIFESKAQVGPVATQKGMREALKYIRGHPKLGNILLQLALIIAFVFPLIFTTFRVYLQKKFALDAKGFGLVFSFPGMGALLGSLTFLLTSPKNPLKVLPFGIIGVCLTLAVIPLFDTLIPTIAAVTIFSFCMFLSISSLTVTTQLTIDNQYRGRISALVGMGFVSLAPIMSGPMGLLSDIVGERALIWSVAIVLFVASAALFIRDKNLGSGLRRPRPNKRKAGPSEDDDGEGHPLRRLEP
ncbi:MAG TPA: MFS transporter [Bdellovibrionales bacterium]|nr:MFS transporter [Bdellovibrionales bacterium]